MTDSNKTLTWIGALALIFAFGLAAGSAHGAEQPPSLRAAEGYQGERGDHRRHASAGSEVIEATPAPEKPARAQAAQSRACCSHYIYSGFTELFDDFDGDGYFTYLRINVDIDTDYFESDVYLKAFLRGSYGGWHRIYTSHVFTINGTSAFDDYEIETELLSGFAPDYYDVLVEVYEAGSGKLLVEYGALENASFGLRPLEDLNRDGAIVAPVVSSYGTSGGGSSSLLLIGFLATLTLWRRGLRFSHTKNTAGSVSGCGDCRSGGRQAHCENPGTALVVVASGCLVASQRGQPVSALQPPHLVQDPVLTIEDVAGWAVDPQAARAGQHGGEQRGLAV